MQKVTERPIISGRGELSAPIQLCLPGIATREAQAFHAPGHGGFFTLNFQTQATVREAERARLIERDIKDYESGQFDRRTLDATREAGLFSDALTVDDRIAELKAAAKKLRPWGMRQHAFPVSALPKVIEQFQGRADFDDADVWISQNGFLRKNRQATNVLHLNMLFADLDIEKSEHYTKKLAPEGRALAFVNWCLDEGLPLPSFIIHSGGGLHPKWLFQQSVPRAAKPVWDALESHLIQRMKDGGWPVDEGVRDVSRILRLAGSKNQKYQGDDALVRVVWTNGGDVESCTKYDFNWLADSKVLLPFSRAEARQFKQVAEIWDKNRQAAAAAAFVRGVTRPAYSAQELSAATLWHSRLSYIRRLVEIRFGKAGVPASSRNNYAWIAANALAWSCGCSDDYTSDLVPVLQEIAPSLSTVEAHASASAVSKRIKQEIGQGTGLYQMKNETFRDKLQITDEEWAALRPAEGEDGKPKKAKATQAHWEIGSMGFERMANLPFEEYQAETKRRQQAAAAKANATRKSAGRTSKKAELLPRVRELAAAGKTQREIAAEVGVGQMTVSRWLQS